MTNTLLQVGMRALFVASVGMSAVAQDVPSDAEGEEPRVINVTIEIVLPDDEPFPEIAFELYVRPLDRQRMGNREVIAAAVADEEGIIRFGAVQVPPEHERVLFGWHIQNSEFFDREQVREYPDRYLKLRRTYYLPHLCALCLPLAIELNGDNIHFERRIEAAKVVQIRGAVERAEGGPIPQARVWARQSETYNMTNRNGEIPLLLVPAETANEVFVLDFPVIVSQHLEARQTLVDRNLGIIQIPKLDRSVPFDGVIRREFELRYKRWVNAPDFGFSAGITIISQDGETVLTWLQTQHEPEGAARLMEQGETPLFAPPGIYYVAAGVFDAFSARDIQLGLLDLIRTGVDLTDSGIPQLVLVEGEYGGMHEFDAVEIDRAIRAALDRHLPSVEP